MPFTTTVTVQQTGESAPSVCTSYTTPTVVPPGCNLRWNIKDAATVKRLTEALITRSRAVHDAVAAAAPAPSWAAVMQPMADDETTTRAESAALEFLQHVSASKELRDASTDCDKMISEFGVECEMRVDVYNAVQAFAETVEAKALTGERARFLARVLRDFKRNGLHLAEGLRGQIKTIKERMSKLSIDFSKNCNDENTKFEMGAEELDGLPQSVFEGLTQLDSGKYEVPLSYFPYMPCMDYVKVEATRKKLETAFNSRCQVENTPILTELCQLRHEKARLLGYPDHATFVLQVRMAKSPLAVLPFLTALAGKLAPLRAAERAVLLELKRKETVAANEHFDGKINGWDFRYYVRMVKEQDYQVHGVRSHCCSRSRATESVSESGITWLNGDATRPNPTGRRDGAAGVLPARRRDRGHVLDLPGAARPGLRGGRKHGEVAPRRADVCGARRRRAGRRAGPAGGVLLPGHVPARGQVRPRGVLGPPAGLRASWGRAAAPGLGLRLQLYQADRGQARTPPVLRGSARCCCAAHERDCALALASPCCDGGRGRRLRSLTGGALMRAWRYVVDGRGRGN
jgi:hypothetical protein